MVFNILEEDQQKSINLVTFIMHRRCHKFDVHTTVNSRENIICLNYLKNTNVFVDEVEIKFNINNDGKKNGRKAFEYVQ